MRKNIKYYLETEVPKGTPVFKLEDYKGENFTTDMPLDTEFYYLTTRVSNKVPLLLQCKIINRIDNCNNCPIKDFRCDGINCNAKVIKIIRP